MDTTAHPPVEEGVESDDLNTTTITMVGLVSAALVLASALGVKALFDYTLSDLSTQKLATAEELERMNADDATEPDTPQPFPGKEGVYSIPIERAMELVVKELSQDSQPE